MSEDLHTNSASCVVLCVEDEQDLLRDIVDELAEAGYRTMEATDGHEALAQLETRRPDLVLCDICMPGLDGFGLLDTVRKKGTGYAEIPFVYLTALSDPREVVEGKRFGADDYLVKPIDYDLLIATVDARLREIERIRTARRNRDIRIDEETLATRFELTPTESRVALALTQGRQPAQIASDFGIARTTVAFHMRNIFDKTQTHRQTELVALLLRLGLS